jgi:hypothetical protein
VVGGHARASLIGATARNGWAGRRDSRSLFAPVTLALHGEACHPMRHGRRQAHAIEEPMTAAPRELARPAALNAVRSVLAVPPATLRR